MAACMRTLSRLMPACGLSIPAGISLVVNPIFQSLPLEYFSRAGLRLPLSPLE